MPKTHIVETGLIKTAKDLVKLNIVDWNRLNGYWDNPQEAAESISSWLIAGECHYSIYKDDITKAPNRGDWPGWRHVGNHPEMGRLFWNWFHLNKNGTIHFSDSPDFHGTFLSPINPSDESTFYGDIGLVSASTFMHTMRNFSENYMWISVVDHDTQILIEPMFSIRQIWFNWFSEEVLGKKSAQRTKELANVQLKLF